MFKLLTLLGLVAQLGVTGVTGLTGLAGLTSLQSLEEPPEVWVERLLPLECQFALYTGHIEIAQLMCPFHLQIVPKIILVPPLGASSRKVEGICEVKK